MSRSFTLVAAPRPGCGVMVSDVSCACRSRRHGAVRAFGGVYSSRLGDGALVSELELL